MKYPYTVKYNGKFYNAGEDVPVVEKVDVKVEETVKTETKVEKTVEKPKKRTTKK